MIQGSAIGVEFADALFRMTRIHDGNRVGYAACKEVAAGKSLGVVLFGLVGTGKTHHLVCTVREFEERAWGKVVAPEESAEDLIKVGVRNLMEQVKGMDWADTPAPQLEKHEIENPVDVRYWYVPDLVECLRSEIGEGIRWTSKKCKECALLVLDDFGLERATDFVAEELEQLIDYRYKMHLPIAVSTNLAWDKGIREKYGDRAVSRWSQQCVVAEMTGRDLRVEVAG